MIPRRLVSMMRKTADDFQVEQDILRQTFKRFQVVVMEDLLAYQYGKANLHRSAEAWHNFMKSWGVTPDPVIIKNFLRQDMGSRTAPGPHSDTIYNIDEVEDALREE